MKILIIDDSITINSFLVSIFTQRACYCQSAFTYADSIALIGQDNFDLIMLDLHLPDGEGEDLFLKIKQKSDAKVIVFTSDHDLFKRDFFFQHGALDYLLKDTPVKVTEEDIDIILSNLTSNRNVSILVIDDSSLVRRALQMLIEPRNYRFIGAKDAKEGFALTQKEKPDIIILDLELPDAHGLELLARLKNSPVGFKSKVFVLSGSNHPSLISKAYKMGCVEFLTKPFVSEEIIYKLDSWTKNIREFEKSYINQDLLNQYKNMIDSNMIIYKIDDTGFITYVNDAFCKISGYDENELIGAPHDKTRHPDMPKETFKEIWGTISQKRQWNGITKNISKSGKTYWVKTIINPIFNCKGNVIEYIFMLDDITETMEVKEGLQLKLNSASDDLLEIFNLAQQYERAIDESAILSRADLSGKITYANKAFYDITGFEPAEVIGKTHAILHSVKTPYEQIKELWSFIQEGKIYKSLILNQTKIGKDLWLDTTIVPIMGADLKPKEYMSVRHNVGALVELRQEIEEAQREILYRLGELSETRHRETGNHIKRVSKYSKILGELAGLSTSDINLLYMASPMHDIGKVGIPDLILLKPAKLSEDEFAVMKTHSIIGSELLKTSNLPILKAAAIVAEQHHEQWNGNGYPFGLKEHEIHIFGRIVAIADVFDALGSDRPYKRAWEINAIYDYLGEERGKRFDPLLVDLFLCYKHMFENVKNQYLD